jgi:hypothetical protein
MSLVMTGAAESTQVTVVMSPATGQRKKVMNLRRRSEPTGLKTVFAKRMHSDIPFTYLLPYAAILLYYIRITLIFVILPSLRDSMQFTVPALS